MLALPCASLLVTAAGIAALTNARLTLEKRISFPEMLELIGASWLLNFLPLSPGLFGRIAYQRARHGVSLRDSATVVVESVVLSWLAAAIAVLVIVVPMGRLLDAFSAIVVLSLLIGGLALYRPIGRDSLAAARCFVLALKLVDQCIWTARYLVVFRVLGWHATPSEACVIAALAQTAMLIPFIGNGLGIREWAVGLVATQIPAWIKGPDAADTTLTVALSADLLNRAFEVMVALPIGFLCLWRLKTRVLAARDGQPHRIAAQKP